MSDRGGRRGSPEKPPAKAARRRWWGPRLLRPTLLAAVCLASAAGAQAAGPNVLVNPNFDGGVAGWTSDALLTFDPTLDVDSSAASGSALAQVPSGGAPAVCQCLDADIPAGPVYELGGYFRVAPGQDPEAEVVFILDTFDQRGCAGTSTLGGGLASAPWVPGRWTQAVNWASPGPAKSMRLCGEVSGATPLQANFDGLLLRQVSPSDCRPSATTLCLNQQRFAVTASYQTAGGVATPAQAVPVATASGHLWFFSSDNVEVVIKVIDGCTVNRRFWVFASGLTNVKVVIKVTDTQTGKQVTYLNPLNQPFPTIQDTGAFATCP